MTPSPEKGGIGSVLRLVWEVLGPHLRAQRGRLALVLACRLSMSLSLLGPLILAHLVDKVLPARDLRALGWCFLALVAVHGASYGLWGLQARVSHQATEQAFLSLRQRMLDSILHKPRSFFRTFTPGDLFTRLVHDVDFAAGFFYNSLLRSASYLVFTLLTAVFLLAWNWRLGLASLLLLPGLYLYSEHMHRRLFRRSEESKLRLRDQNEILLDILGGHGEILFFRQQAHALRRFGQASRRFAAANVRANVCNEWVWGGLDALAQAMVLLPFVAGCWLACRGEGAVTAGLLTAFLAYLVQLSSRAQFLFGGLASFAQAAPSLRRIQEVMAFPGEREVVATDLRDLPDDTDIRFEDVGFRYPEGPALFDRFNLRIGVGDKVAIMGPSGAGKSTLLGLLLRFVDPAEGCIRFGGRPVQALDPAFYYSFFGYVGQHTNLFELSIRENVALGWHEVPEDQIWQALDRVRLRATVEALPRGLDTVLGAASTRLSGGQAQRLALARALVREPAVLVLDEFTSGLDRDTEQAILDDLFEVFAAQTILCVTHAPQVAQRFQRVVTL